jgi:hypothetical protein
MAEYRICTDSWLGYEVQVRRWWWPFWVQADFSNTHPSIERAELWAERHAQGCVKYLGRFEHSSQLPSDQCGGEK